MNGIIRPEGPLTLDTVAERIAALGTPAAGVLCVDLSGVSDIDSSAVALLLDWQRQARSGGVQLQFSCAPENLRRLIAVYGVADLLSLTD